MNTHYTSLVGNSQSIQDLNRTIDKIAQSQSPVLITGEVGTGKESIAQAIHERSSRANSPIVMLNVAALTENECEAELFGGSERGAIDKAGDGTLFIQSVENLSPVLQTKLASMIRSGTIRARIIASSTTDLQTMVQAGKFKDELYYALNVIPVSTVPLRNRKEDIATLVNGLIEKMNRLSGNNVDAVSGDIMNAFQAYDWPGNVRELENLVERLVIVKGNGGIEMADLPQRIFANYAANHLSGSGALSEWEFPKMALPNTGLDLKAIVTAFENHLVDQALARTNGNKNRASELLKMNRTTLVEKLRKRGMITPAKYKQGGEDSEENEEMV